MTNASIYTTFLVLLFTVYFLFNTLVFIGWFKLLKYRKKESGKEGLKYHKNTRFSILIPMRNEASNIIKLIEDLVRQEYSVVNYEIIVVDDHSEDNSWQLVNKLRIPNLQLVKNIGEGKKEALLTAQKQANYEYIIQTDADCRIGANWLLSINRYLKNNSVKLLLAPVIFEKRQSFLNSLQELEFYALMVSTAGLTALNKAFMANGANLIYSKEVIDNSDIYRKNIRSGDDVFLLHYVKRKYSADKIHFLISKDATVRTKALNKPTDILNQRIRWASKSKYYKDLNTIFIGVLILLVNLALVMSFIASFNFDNFKLIYKNLFFIKLLTDFYVILPILIFYKRVYLLIYFPILSFVYPFYISFVGLLSQFRNFEWKGRKI